MSFLEVLKSDLMWGRLTEIWGHRFINFVGGGGGGFNFCPPKIGFDKSGKVKEEEKEEERGD